MINSDFSEISLSELKKNVPTATDTTPFATSFCRCLHSFLIAHRGAKKAERFFLWLAHQRLSEFASGFLVQSRLCQQDIGVFVFFNRFTGIVNVARVE